LLSIISLISLSHFAYGETTQDHLARDIVIQTACGADRTRNGTCPSDRGTCFINPIASDIWETDAHCVCKQGYYGNNCQDGPLCNDTSECNGRGQCGVHQLTNGTHVERCVCDSGYFGDDCLIDPCFNVACDNGGTCSGVSIPDGTFSWYCKCPTTHFGNKCQYEKDTYGDDNRIKYIGLRCPEPDCECDSGYQSNGSSCGKFIF